MDCRYSIYHCLCAYLLNGEPDPEELRSIKEDPNLCPRCRTCSARERNRQLELQRNIRFLIQEQFLNVTAPDYLKRNVRIGLERAEEYRESGIQALGLIHWGTHIAQLYNTVDELTEILVPYIGSGLEENELCICVTSEVSEEEARAALVEEIPSLQRYVDTGQLQFISYEDWSLPEAYSDSQCALDNYLGKCYESLRRGYSGLRITGNVSWLGQSDWDSLMGYEDLLNNTITNYKAIVLCAYNESKCTIGDITDIINTHRYVISRIEDSWRLIESEK